MGLLAVTAFASPDGTTRQAPAVQVLGDDASDAVDVAEKALEVTAQGDDGEVDAQDADANQDGDREIKGIPDKSEIGGPPEGPPLDSPARDNAPPFNPDLVDTVETPGGVMVRVPAHAAEHMEAAFQKGRHGGEDGED
jgi:hypothetical protein